MDNGRSIIGSTLRKRKLRENDDVDREILTTWKIIFEESKDRNNLFGRSIAAQIREFPKDVQRVMCFKINKLLF